MAESGYFFSFWDTVGYAVNGLVFFFAGASAVNFFIRCGMYSCLASLLLKQASCSIVLLPNEGNQSMFKSA